MLLEKVRNTLDCGAVYFQKERRSNHCQCYRYTVNAQADIFAKIIPFFKKHPLQSASKGKSFRIFCKIAQLVKQGRHLTADGLEIIQKLKAEMNRRTIGLA